MFCYNMLLYNNGHLVKLLVKRENFEKYNKLKINFESYTEADSASEAVAWSCLVEKVFLKISQNSQEKRVSGTGVSCEFCRISKNTL